MKRILVAGLWTSFIIIGGVSSVLAAPPAYIDPNTGGMLAQVLIVLFGMLTGVWFFFANRIKMSFNRMMRTFREKKGGPVTQEITAADAPQENNLQ